MTITPITIVLHSTDHKYTDVLRVGIVLGLVR